MVLTGTGDHKPNWSWYANKCTYGLVCFSISFKFNRKKIGTQIKKKKQFKLVLFTNIRMKWPESVWRTLWLTWLVIINVFIVVLDELTWWLVSNIVPGRDRFPVVDDTCRVLSQGFKQSKSKVTSYYNKWFYHYYDNQGSVHSKHFYISLTWNKM